ncbi:serine hydrolase domain-containing protein [Ferrimicrobium sp.]|uniref:serine hydrolase domain-containing protein n=1 Tax=Ferrimicrobium sp. TaxID=2926050 RepID=UPI00261782CE|nr:serine hydrolase domain-containing protein [Ferrimicrobium sp.]
MSEFQHPRPSDAAEALAASTTRPILSSSFLSIDQLFLDFLTEHRVPGLVWGVVDHSGLIHHGAHGVKNVTTQVSTTHTDVFRIASMTKSFTALCALHLRDQGSITLADPLTHWLPELKIQEPPYGLDAPITIGDLLSMSSGLVEDDPWADRQLALSKESFLSILSTGVGLDLTPSTAFEYSNLGYAIVGMIIERAAGVPLATVAADAIFTPLHMDSTTWNLPTFDPARVVSGYSLCDGQWQIEPLLGDGVFGAMGGLGSTIEDLAKWVALHLNAWPTAERLVRPTVRSSTLREMADVHRVMSQPRLTGPDLVAQGYGYGLMIAHHRLLGRVVGHSGGLPGFGSRMEWLPEYGVGLVALANRTYTPLADVVRRGLTLLVEEGYVITKAVQPSPELLQIYRVINETYLDPLRQSSLEKAALPTYLLDRDDDRRPPDFASLRETYGQLAVADPLVPTGSLRGHWTLRCQHGTLTVQVMLGPMAPHGLQFLQINEAPASE